MIANQFLILTDTGPQCHLLHEQSVRALYDGLRVATKRDQCRDEPTARLSVYRSIFRCDTSMCFPVTEEGMAGLAENYVGPYQARMRYMAAALALGEPIEPQEDDGGGQPAVLVPETPRYPPLPSGVPLGHLL